MAEDAASFIVREYVSASGWYWEWETDGSKEPVQAPFQYANSSVEADDWHARVTVKPGDHLFLRTNNEGDSGDEEDYRRYLIEVPQDPAAFRQFKEQAEATVGDYDRILSYKQERKGPFNYTNDFKGHWLKDYVVRSWEDWEPRTLAEALALL